MTRAVREGFCAAGTGHGQRGPARGSTHLASFRCRPAGQKGCSLFRQRPDEFAAARCARQHETLAWWPWNLVAKIFQVHVHVKWALPAPRIKHDAGCRWRAPVTKIRLPGGMLPPAEMTARWPNPSSCFARRIDARAPPPVRNLLKSAFSIRARPSPSRDRAPLARSAAVLRAAAGLKTCASTTRR